MVENVIYPTIPTANLIMSWMLAVDMNDLTVCVAILWIQCKLQL